TRLDDDVFELFQIGEAAWFLRGERDGLPLGDRRLSDLPGPDRRLGLADRLSDISGGQLACRELLGVEPDAQGIVLLPETGDLADAGKAKQLVLDLDAGVVAQVEVVAAPVRRGQPDEEEDTGQLLLDRYPVSLDLVRKARQGAGDALLHQHASLVEID